MFVKLDDKVLNHQLFLKRGEKKWLDEENASGLRQAAKLEKSGERLPGKEISL